jgi:hypothetical protein
MPATATKAVAWAVAGAAAGGAACSMVRGPLACSSSSSSSSTDHEQQLCVWPDAVQCTAAQKQVAGGPLCHGVYSRVGSSRGAWGLR